MPRMFNDEVEAAGAGQKSQLRALQAWIYLLGKATNRQLVLYPELSAIMGYGDERPLARILGFVAYYCQEHGLPPLTVIVVNRFGEPGGGFPNPDNLSLGQLREQVYGYNWFGLMPPTIDEFEEARDAVVG